MSGPQTRRQRMFCQQDSSHDTPNTVDLERDRDTLALLQLKLHTSSHQRLDWLLQS